MEGIVDKAHLEKLRDSMLATAREIKATKTRLTDFVRPPPSLSSPSGAHSGLAFLESRGPVRSLSALAAVAQIR